MSLLPPNADAFEKAIEAAVSVHDVPVSLRALLNPYTCPPPLLPWLAYAMSVDTWDPTWPVTIQRERIASSLRIHQLKGTAWAVREVVRSFGGQLAIREWFEVDPPAPPHTFEIVLTLQGDDGETASEAYINQVIDEVVRAKRLSSHFTFTLGISAAAQLGLQAAARPAVYARLDCIGA